MVKPDTFIRWHRKGFRSYWRRKRSVVVDHGSENLRDLIAEMASADRTWGEERIAAELLLKLEVRVSPRTVRLHRPTSGPRKSDWGAAGERQVAVHTFDAAVSATRQTSVIRSTIK